MSRAIFDRLTDRGITYGTADPSVAPGYNAPIGHMMVSAGALFIKTGVGATDWVAAGGGGGGGGSTTFALVFEFGDGSAAVTAGAVTGMVRLPVGATLTRVDLVGASGPGDCVIDVQQAALPTDGSAPGWASVVGSGTKPTLASASSDDAVSLTDWGTSYAAGDLLRAVVDSATTLTKITLTLTLTAS